MSGNPTSNVVPMAKAPTPATAPPQMPMPMPGMWGGGGSLPWGPGCCPPGGMDALMKCYCDVQAATAFICSVMVQCVQTNPAVVQAIIAAIEASGSSLPLLGVTNGEPAAVGQVGEFEVLTASQTYPATAGTYQPVTMGILQPGDWDIWAYVRPSTPMDWISISINPLPAGVYDSLSCVASSGDAPLQYFTLVSPATRALLSLPTLFVLNMGTDNTTGGTGGTASLALAARRRR